MPSLLLLFAFLGDPVDEYCRETYGHPGNLGVTLQAREYFQKNISYEEAVATIGELGREVPTTNKRQKIYRWQGGLLEMHLVDGKLYQYCWGGKMNTFYIPAAIISEQRRQATVKKPQLTRSQNGTIEQDDGEHLSANDYDSFQDRVERVIETSSQVNQDDQEARDLRTLKFLLPKYRDAVAARDWNKANELRRQMSVALTRGQFVATDAPRRMAAQQRADEERRHRDEMRQRERQHQEEMNQRQQLINQLRSPQPIVVFKSTSLTLLPCWL